MNSDDERLEKRARLRQFARDNIKGDKYRLGDALCRISDTPDQFFDGLKLMVEGQIDRNGEALPVKAVQQPMASIIRRIFDMSLITAVNIFGAETGLMLHVTKKNRTVIYSLEYGRARHLRLHAENSTHLDPSSEEFRIDQAKWMLNFPAEVLDPEASAD